MDDLALEVGGVDDVVIDDADRANASGSKVERRRRAESAGADHQDLGTEQLELASLANLRDHQVAAVAAATLGVEHLGLGPGVTGLLPAGEATGQRDDVGVAELGERLRAEGRAGAGGARQHDALALVGCLGLDARLEETARNVHGFGNRALLVLVGLTHVDQQRRLRGGELVGQLACVDLGDLLLDLGKQFAVRRHRSITFVSAGAAAHVNV